MHIVLWSRGMATAYAIEFCSYQSSFTNTTQSSRIQCQDAIKFLVLDGPYESIQGLVDDCIAKLSRDGYALPTILVGIFSKLVRRTLTERLDGVDPYSVKPVDLVSSIEKPCLVIASTKDDYISFNNGVNIAEKWGGPCRLRMYELSHFQSRPPELLDVALSEIMKSLNITAAENK